jgi:hypothetical protein
MKLTDDLRKVRMADVIEFMKIKRNAMNPGETLEVEVPDFTQVGLRWVKASEEERWTTLIKEIYGPQEGNGIFLSGYNQKTLTSILNKAGFQNVKVTVQGPTLVGACTA